MQEHRKIILIFVIFVVGTITISTINDIFALHAEDFITKQLKEQIESSSLILTTGFVNTQTDSYSISDNIEIRHIYPGQMMRIYGLTTDGYPFYVVHRENLEDQTISGTIFTASGPESIIMNLDVNLEPIMPIETGPLELEAPGPESLPIKAVVLMPHHTYWRQFLNVNVKVFEADSNWLDDYWFKSNLVANVPVLIEISHETGKHLTTIEGITDDNGYFQGSYYIVENLVRGGKYNVHLEVGYQSNFKVQELVTFVRGEIVGARDDVANFTNSTK